jgi:hypothetical protein
MLAASEQAAVPPAEAYLGAPGKVANGFGELWLAGLDLFRDLGPVAVGLGRFDQNASGMAVARLRDAAEPAPIRELRDLTRYLKVLIQDRTREANRLHKLLEDAGIKLASVATDVLGVSGLAMLDALVRGMTDPEVLAELARGKLRAKLPALRQALTGRFRPHHAVLVSQLLAHLDYMRIPGHPERRFRSIVNIGSGGS